MQADISAIFVMVPEAEPLVGPLRAKYDPAASVGVPAHITALVPFMPRDRLTDAVLKRVRSALHEVAPFSFKLERVARFSQTTYLAPEPPEPFVAITAALMREFPDYPLYGGRFSEIIPHLTVADQDEKFAGIAERELADRLERYGGVRANCRVIEIYENAMDGYWRRFESFDLGTHR